MRFAFAPRRNAPSVSLNDPMQLSFGGAPRALRDRVAARSRRDGRSVPGHGHEAGPQLPLFRALGSPPGQKRPLTFPAGHSSYGWRDQFDREGLNWLDQQFGPVSVAANP